MKRLLPLLMIQLLTACASMESGEDSGSREARLGQAEQIIVFEAGDNEYPEVLELLGEITANSCRRSQSEPPATREDALTNLRLEAMTLEANGIINVVVDEMGVGTFATDCLESAQASGVAVKFQFFQ